MNKPQTQFYTLCVTFNLILTTILGAHAFGDENATTETKVGQGQLYAILNLPSIQKELGLDDDQIAAITKIKVNPIPTTFADAILPLNTILLEEQLKEFKRIAFQGLMVRAFTIAEVQESLTPDQKSAIAAIQCEYAQLAIVPKCPFSPISIQRELHHSIAVSSASFTFSLAHKRDYTLLLSIGLLLIGLGGD